MAEPMAARCLRARLNLRPDPADCRPCRALLTAVLAALPAFAGCSSTNNSPNHSVAVATLQKVNRQAHQCWLGDTSFKSYGMVPELDTAGTPRLLVIPRGKPQALPRLVIAATGPEVEIYGPLAASPLGPRIHADVGRWANGDTGCAA